MHDNSQNEQNIYGHQTGNWKKGMSGKIRIHHRYFKAN